jgi:hypothetical protein
VSIGLKPLFYENDARLLSSSLISQSTEIHSDTDRRTHTMSALPPSYDNAVQPSGSHSHAHESRAQHLAHQDDDYSSSDDESTSVRRRQPTKDEIDERMSIDDEERELPDGWVRAFDKAVSVCLIRFARRLVSGLLCWPRIDMLKTSYSYASRLFWSSFFSRDINSTSIPTLTLLEASGFTRTMTPLTSNPYPTPIRLILNRPKLNKPGPSTTR